MAFSSIPPEDATPDKPPTDNDSTASVEENAVKKDADLLNAVLPPLLKDFQHWFSRTTQLLETQDMPFLSPVEQANLLERVRVAAQQVSASQSLAAVTEGQAGIEMPVVMAWHKLVYECWGVALRYKKESAARGESTARPDNSSKPPDAA